MKLFKILVGVVLSFMAVFSGAAYAVIDVSAVTAGITDAQTAITIVILALLGLSTALYGLVMVYRFVQRKSGV